MFLIAQRYNRLKAGANWKYLYWNRQSLWGYI